VLEGQEKLYGANALADLAKASRVMRNISDIV